MARSYTGRGKKWEWLNSWWLIFTFVPFGVLSCLSFMFVGIQVKNKKWLLSGLVYVAAFITAFAMPNSGLGAGIAVFSWLISIIHAFIIRPAYLIQLDMLKENEPRIHLEKIERLRQEAAVRFERELNMEISSDIEQKKSNQDPVQQSTVTSSSNIVDSNIQETEIKHNNKTIDLNSATEAEIASISGIGLILAKKVVLKREELGGFDSFEQFTEVIGLNEHKAEKIKLLVTLSAKAAPTTQDSTGRLIDF
ncbi:ComEA family DNA-binding protein [Bacillus sp. PS06]|uniref:ComEA family DNA-binding protein n=1 Tax=Bacillus sp. PS06 TaxID=2764176 RepID=UPI0017838B7B|nr:helix-hairpin-helix domain-containing protein [Bacillus sp. PS06]MBD8067471.1 helix-hairpin-helix domain-containing protein [Bacillus sp. PS06]